MSVPSRESLEKILGQIDDNSLAAIQDSGASLRDVSEAKAIADGKSDIVGQGEQEIRGPVKQVLTILTCARR